MPGTTVFYGYHGTTVKAARSIQRSGFTIRQNRYDWLGDGIYFFQDAPNRAWKWAETHHPGSEPAVICAAIDSLDCMDLLDTIWFPTIKKGNKSCEEQYGKIGVRPRQNSFQPGAPAGPHQLDCDVFNHTVGVLRETNIIIRSIRAVFLEGDPVFDTSHVFDLAHVQIAVRDPGVITELILLDK